jgi:hypothetical protein
MKDVARKQFNEKNIDMEKIWKTKQKSGKGIIQDNCRSQSINIITRKNEKKRIHLP